LAKLKIQCEGNSTNNFANDFIWRR